MQKIFLLSIIILFQSNLYSQRKWSLEECISHAQIHNLTIKQKQLDAANKGQDKQMALNEKLPGVTADWNNQSNFGQSQDIFGTVKRNDNFNNNLGINARILLFNSGRLKKQVAKADSDFVTAEYAVENARRNVAIQVTRSYLKVLLAKEMVTIGDSAVENARKMWEKAKITTAAGTTAQSVKYEAEAGFAKEKQRLQAARIEVKRSLLELSQLLQLTENTLRDVQDIDHEILPQQPDSTIADSLWSIIYNRQPVLKMYEAGIRSAVLQRDIIKVQYGPSVTAGAAAGTAYFNSFQSPGKTYWQQAGDNFAQQLSLNISIPVFDKRRKTIQLQKSEIARQSAANELDIQKQVIRQEIEKIHFDIQGSHENYVAALEAVRSAQLAALYAQKSYDAGMGSIYDAANARNNLVSAQGALLQAKYNWMFGEKLLALYIKE